MKVTIFGAASAGLVTGTYLTDVGHDFVCVDIDAAKVEGLDQRHVPSFGAGPDEQPYAITEILTIR